jgi:hypothetical protein
MVMDGVRIPIGADPPLGYLIAAEDRVRLGRG